MRWYYLGNEVSLWISLGERLSLALPFNYTTDCIVVSNSILFNSVTAYLCKLMPSFHSPQSHLTVIPVKSQRLWLGALFVVICELSVFKRIQSRMCLACMIYAAHLTQGIASQAERHEIQHACQKQPCIAFVYSLFCVFHRNEPLTVAEIRHTQIFLEQRRLHRYGETCNNMTIRCLNHKH